MTTKMLDRIAHTYDMFRFTSLDRFLPTMLSDALKPQKVAGVEYCSSCKLPLAMFHVGSPGSHTTPLESVAHVARIPAFLVFFDLDRTDLPDIKSINVRELPDGEAQRFDPEGFAYWLARLHLRCPCDGSERLFEEATDPEYLYYDDDARQW